MLWSSSIILNLATTWWPLDGHLNAAMKLRHLQSFTSLFAWAPKSCANDRKAQKIIACNDGEKKRPPPHIHLKWQRFRHYGCIVYSTLLSFSTRGTINQMAEIFLNTKTYSAPHPCVNQDTSGPGITNTCYWGKGPQKMKIFHDFCY